MIALVFPIFIVGIINGFVPGAVTSMSFAEIMRAGLLAGLRVVLLAMVLETSVAVMMTAAVWHLPIPPVYFYWLGLFGAGFLLLVARDIWRSSVAHVHKTQPIPLWELCVLTVTNPPLLIFWLTVAPGQILHLSQTVSHAAPLFIFLIEIGWLLGSTCVVLFLTFERPRLLRHEDWVFRLLAAILVLFAARVAWQSLAGIMSA